MGKRPGPSAEELEFIFGCFVRGLSDAEVLYEMEDTDFPQREKRFIRERRRHFEAAKKVLMREELARAERIVTADELARHRQDIKALAERLEQELQVPSARDIFSLPLREEYAYQGILSWRLTAQGAVDVSLPLERDAGLKPVRQSLLRHLESGGFAEATSKLGQWKDQCAQYLTQCYKLLETVRTALEEKGATVPDREETRPGPAVSLPLAVCIAVVEGPGLFHGPEYEGFQHSDRLFGLRWCGETLAFAATNEGLDHYQHLHASLRERFVASRAARDIHERHTHLESIQRQVEGNLNRFCAAVPLPGSCDICRPETRLDDEV